MTLTPTKTSNVGFTVRRETAPFRGHALTVSRHIPAGTPAPTPTVWTEYANEVDLRVEGGPGQIVATFEMCCHRTYLLELRDIRTQAKLLQWSYVSTANWPAVHRSSRRLRQVWMPARSTESAST